MLQKLFISDKYWSLDLYSTVLNINNNNNNNNNDVI